MTGAPADERIGPGGLVLVVGPSGAGKDTLIRAAREKFSGDPAFVFPRRLITRPPSDAEDNEAVSEADFARLASAGGFALRWSAHGLSYGIPLSINSALSEGRTVVCNVSRLIIADARRRYNILVIEITARPDLLAKRLAARGRAQDGAVSRRLERSTQVGEIRADLTIVNEGPLECASSLLIAALSRQATSTRPSVTTEGLQLGQA